MDGEETGEAAGSGGHAPQGGGITFRVGELATSLALILVGCIVMYGSIEQGIGWDDSGPMAGYFPFYIGLFLTLSCLGTIAKILLQWSRGGGSMTSRQQLRRVLAVFIPICIYVMLLPLVGMYVSSGLFIAWFMRRLAEEGTGYSWVKISGIAVAVPLASYLIFTRWFEISLPAGPFPAWFGF